MDERDEKKRSESWARYKQHSRDLKEAKARGDKETVRRILEEILEQAAPASNH